MHEDTDHRQCDLLRDATIHPEQHHRPVGCVLWVEGWLRRRCASLLRSFRRFPFRDRERSTRSMPSLYGERFAKGKTGAKQKSSRLSGRELLEETSWIVYLFGANAVAVLTYSSRLATKKSSRILRSTTRPYSSRLRRCPTECHALTSFSSGMNSTNWSTSMLVSRLMPTD